MTEERKFKIENPFIVLTAITFLLISTTLIIIGILNFNKVVNNDVASNEEGLQEAGEDQNLSEFFKEDFRDYNIPEDANIEYLRNDPFRGTCTGSESDESSPFSYGVVCLP